MSFSGDGLANTQHPTNTNAKIEQLKGYTWRVPADGDKHAGLFNGAPLPNVDTSLRSGPKGATALHDPVARERISHFDHERIPERVVHARGAGAHGKFTLHKSLEHVTCAKVLTEVGKETPVFTRFSTVLGQNGAAETAREVRGFAVKMYTEEGNWDVGNNIPVFFIQDGIKFVDLIHAAKPEPQLHLPQAQTAHDNFWDFISLMPESTHMIAWMLSDYTIPRSYRMTPGFGVHTWVLVNAEGKRTYAKFHFMPKHGIHGLVWDECVKLMGTDPDFHRRDLAEAIEGGAFPQWDFGVQLIPVEDEDKFDFDLMDATKLVPEHLYPIEFVGTLELNRNPTNYFSETEQVAFCTSNVVPGVDFSNDPMLQTRNFSYFDTQLSRLGGPNFNQIPINQSRCPVVTTARDAQHSHFIKASPNYHPNRFDVPKVQQMNGANYAHDQKAIDEATKIDPNYQTYAPYKVEESTFGRLRPHKFAEHHKQATYFYNSMSPAERAHMVEAAQFELGHCDVREVQERMMARFAEIDYDFGCQVAAGFGIDVPKPNKPNHGEKESEDSKLPMSMRHRNNKYTVAGRKIAIMALDGYDYTQVKSMKTAFEAMGVIVMIVGLRKGPAHSKDGKTIDTHWTIESARSVLFDAVFFPDGNEAYEKSLGLGRVIHYARETYGHQKTLAAAGVAVKWICHKCMPGDTQLDATATKGWSESKGTILAPHLVIDEQSVVSKAAGAKDAVTFGDAFANALKNHRHFDRDVTGVAF